MDSKNGSVVGDLRVLVKSMGDGLLYLTATLWRAVFGKEGWVLVVTPVDSPEVLVRRTFTRLAHAKRARDKFVRVAQAQQLDRTDLPKIKRVLWG